MTTETKTKIATIDRKEFVDALTVIGGTIRPDSTNINDSSNYLIIQDGSLCCVANQFMLRIPMNIDIDKPIVNVEFRLIYDYVRRIRNKDIMLGITPNGTLGLKAGNSRVEFAITDEFYYDNETLVTDEEEWKALPENFVNAMQFTTWASNPADCATAHLAVVNGRMYGQNMRDRIACYDMLKAGMDSFGDGVVYIHGDCLSFAAKYMGYDATKGAPKYTINGSWLHLRTTSGIIFSSRTRADSNFDVEFVESLLEKGDSAPFRFNKEFEEILERINPFTGKDIKLKKVTIRISNTIKGKDGSTEADSDSSFLAITAIREDGSRVYEQAVIRRVEQPLHFTVGYNALCEMVKYGEVFTLADGRLVATGSTDNGKSDGTPLYKAIVTLMTE